MIRLMIILSVPVFLLSACAPGTATPPTAQAEEIETKKVSTASGTCPQPRKTTTAPRIFLKKKNPHDNPAGAKAGKNLYLNGPGPFTCDTCHGKNGDGKGDPDFESTPEARNFTCKETMSQIPDGQLFWIIKNGSAGTSMPAFMGHLSDDEIWKIIAHLRTLAQ